MKSFLSRPSTTTGLLGVIAVLLLILVVQNFSNTYRGSRGPMTDPQERVIPMAGGGMVGHPPITTSGNSMPVGESGEFDNAMMVFASMNCPDDPTLTLDAPACGSDQANQRREAVRGIVAKGTSIRGIFDAVVETFGESSLPPQAIQIRRSRIMAEQGK